MFLEIIFDNADFRKSIAEILNGFEEVPQNIDEFYLRINSIFEDTRNSGNAIHPEGESQYKKFNEYMEIQREYVLAAGDSTMEYNRQAFWPNPEKGGRYGGSIYNTLPVLKNEGLLTKETPFGSGGGCFNTMITDRIIARGYNYIGKELDYDVNTRIGVTNADPKNPRYQASCLWGIMLLSSSYAYIAELAYGEREIPNILLPVTKSPPRFADPFRCGVIFPSTEAYIEEYPRHIQNTRDVFSECKVFLAFIGVNEGWGFLKDGTMLPRHPGYSSTHGVLKFHTLSIEDNIRYLKRFVDLVTAHNRDIQIILGISPVPIIKTGLGLKQHVINANTLGKAIMRLAVEEVVNSYDHVHYLASLEAGTTCVRDSYASNDRYASDEAQEKIMEVFEAQFLTGAEV